MPSAKNYSTNMIAQIVHQNGQVATTVLEGVTSGTPEKIEGWVESSVQETEAATTRSRESYLNARAT